MADDVEIGENAEGKYFLIEVPDFNNGSDDPGAKRPKMTSYLRLGAVKDKTIAGNPSAPAESGEDLAAKVRRVTRIDGVTPAEGSAQRSLAFATQDLVFEDDFRERDPGAPVTNVVGDVLTRTEIGASLDSPAEEGSRLAETLQLHTKGGWRDHSDGNRISTTRGDKVEVIRGNYKLVVLGRQENLDNASGWDLSGGELRDTTLNLGEYETTSVEWVEDDGGRWRVVEKNQKGDSFSIYWGNVHEEFFGEIKSDVTGSETPGAYPHPVPGVAPPSKVNPKIIERTWAASIEGYTGTAVLPVPWTKEVTWVAGDIYEETHAGSTTGVTVITGGTKETTTIALGTMESTVVGLGTMESTVVGAGTLETTAVAGAAIGATAIGGAKIEVTAVGGVILEATAAPIQIDLKAGLFSLGLTLMPLAIEIFLGKKIEINLLDSIEIQLIGKTEIEEMKHEIRLMKTEISANSTEIAEANDQIAEAHTVLAAVVSML